MIDDDEFIAGSLRDYLVTRGVCVEVALEPAAAERLMSSRQYATVVVDPYLTGGVYGENASLLDQMVETLASHKERSAKPFLAIAHPGHVEPVMADIRARLIARGVAVFGSFQSAAEALRRATDYWRSRQDLN